MVGSLVPARCKRLGAATLWLALTIPTFPGNAALPGTSATMRDCPADLVASPAHVRAHATATGAAGPFANARVTLIRSDDLFGPFTGRLDVGSGRCLLLMGPDDPTGVFDFFVKAILFTPLGPRQPNGIIVLYDQVHRTFNPHTYPGVLVYSIDDRSAARRPALEQRLDGIRSATQVRRRLRIGRPG